ncbi:MAG: alginate export family protein, partial [Pseudomonadales bacterium]|nr:alginate export family protein [Pseudomonadales bacterium]
ALRDAAGLPPRVELAFSQRSRFEAVSNNWRRGQRAGRNDQLALQSRLRLGVAQGAWSVLTELQDARNPGAQPEDFTGRMRNETDVLQLLAAYHWEAGAGDGLQADVHVGRFCIDLGSTRLVGRNGYPNTTDSYEGVHVQAGSAAGDWRIRGLLVRPTRILESRVDERDPDQRLWGVALDRFESERVSSGVYALGLRATPDDAADRERRLTTVGVRRVRRPLGLGEDRNAQVKAAWDYEFEAIAQFGERFQRDHAAWLAVAKLGYTFDLAWRPRVEAQYLHASGSDDPAGDDSRSFDRLFGLRLFDLTQTSLYGPFGQTNHQLVGWRLDLRPSERLTLGLKHHLNWLAEGKDQLDGSAVSGPALVDPTGRSGRWLGHDVELTARYRLGPRLEFAGGWSHWLKGDWFDGLAQLPDRGGLPSGGEHDSSYLWLQSSVRF